MVSLGHLGLMNQIWPSDSKSDKIASNSTTILILAMNSDSNESLISIKLRF